MRNYFLGAMTGVVLTVIVMGLVLLKSRYDELDVVLELSQMKEYKIDGFRDNAKYRFNDDGSYYVSSTKGETAGKWKTRGNTLVLDDEDDVWDAKFVVQGLSCWESVGGEDLPSHELYNVKSGIYHKLRQFILVG